MRRLSTGASRRIYTVVLQGSPGSHTACRLQRLPQSLFQLSAIGSADFRSRAVFQDDFKFAMRDRLQMQDAFDVHDRRTMDADETSGIEPLGKLVQRGPVQDLLASDVEVRINPGRFDPIDLGHGYEAGGTRGFHHQAIERQLRRGDGGNDAKNAPSELRTLRSSRRVLTRAMVLSKRSSLKGFRR